MPYHAPIAPTGQGRGRLSGKMKQERMNSVLNIFRLYLENEKKVPFVVRRNSWGEDYGLLVLSVELNRYPASKGGPYGTATGFGLPPLNGNEPQEYWGLPGCPVEVRNAGSWQWERVENIPQEWSGIVSQYSR